MRWTVLGVTAGLGILTAGVIAGYTQIAGNERPVSFTDDDWGIPESLTAVVRNSEVILVGTLVELGTETRELRSPITGDVQAERTERVLRFQVLESIRGTFEPGAIVEVRETERVRAWGTAGAEGPTVNVDTRALTRGTSYLVLLTRFSQESGDALGFTGSLGAAEVEGGSLRWVAPLGFWESLQEAEVALDPSFSQQLDGVRELAASVAYAPLEDHPGDANEALAIALAFEQLLAEAPDLGSAAAVEARALELGLSRATVSDPLQCRKIEMALAELVGSAVSVCSAP